MAERNHCPLHGRHQHLAGNLLRIGTKFTRIAHGDAKPFAPLDGRGDHLAAQGLADDILQIADRQPVAGQLRAVRFNVQVKTAGNPFRESRGGARNRLDDRLNFAGQPLHLIEILAEHLDPDWRPDAGRQHVDARLDRHRPGVRDARELQCLIHFGDQLVGCHARAPFGLRLQIDHRLEHLRRRRVCCCVGTTRFAIDRGDFRETLDDLVLSLQQFRRFGD